MMHATLSILVSLSLNAQPRPNDLFACAAVLETAGRGEALDGNALTRYAKPIFVAKAPEKIQKFVDDFVEENPDVKGMAKTVLGYYQRTRALLGFKKSLVNLPKPRVPVNQLIEGRANILAHLREQRARTIELAETHPLPGETRVPRVPVWRLLANFGGTLATGAATAFSFYQFNDLIGAEMYGPAALMGAFAAAGTLHVVPKLFYQTVLMAKDVVRRMRGPIPVNPEALPETIIASTDKMIAILESGSSQPVTEIDMLTVSLPYSWYSLRRTPPADELAQRIIQQTAARGDVRPAGHESFTLDRMLIREEDDADFSYIEVGFLPKTKHRVFQ